MPRRRRRTPDGGSGHRKLVVGIIIGLSVALLPPGTVAASAVHVDDALLAPPPAERVHGDDELLVRIEDAAYMNRIYSEADHEVAYCGLLTDDRPPRLEIWLADTLNAGPRFVEFVTDNCPSAMREVLLHTHPSGALRLSEADRRQLATSQATMLCVQGGPLPTEPAARADNLACYIQRQPDRSGLSLRRVGVGTVASDALVE